MALEGPGRFEIGFRWPEEVTPLRRGGRVFEQAGFGDFDIADNHRPLLDAGFLIGGKFLAATRKFRSVSPGAGARKFPD